MLYTELFTGTVLFIHCTVKGQGHYTVKLKSGHDPATTCWMCLRVAFTLTYSEDISSGIEPTTLWSHGAN